ncbi:hypothetical protein EFQ99_16155 [Rhizobium vallis]|uniref:Uncharacterized protein n=1 Tax=Rhizobium vallis TaxID=634290 RepID=A0A432PIW5_9HYPH|nr:hypothetical protein EFQ99_16155 [Rhizobium vallis]
MGAWSSCARFQKNIPNFRASHGRYTLLPARSKRPYRLPIAVFSSSRITGDIAHLFDLLVTS